MTTAACLTAVVTISSLASAQADGGRTRQFKYLMGTSVRVETYGTDASTRERASAEAFAAVAEVDRVMSGYRSDSELVGVNAHASAGRVAVSAPLFAVLAAGQRVALASHGAFTIMSGGAGDADVQLDPASSSVVLRRPGASLTLDGLAKGFASELAANVLARSGLSGVVDIGGVQYMVGSPPGKRAWTVGLSDPRRPGTLIGAVDFAAGAVATATSASVPFDPRTQRPSVALSATVISNDGTLADALSRAALVLGPRDGLALLSEFPSTWGVITAVHPDGRLDSIVSSGHASSFHPATR
ncbi:MAG: FAD:protein FMN transferase [Acidobacteria bacterium]|nr:FAD:protein FMN transferase [Acidobacteriota bacterium]